MIRALPLLCLLASGSAFAAPNCSTPIPVSTLRAGLSQAESAFSALDVERFTTTMDDVVYEIPCLSEPAEPALVAQLHRLQGIRQFVAHDDQRAAEAFAAARGADPSYQLPTWLVPDGHAIRDLYGRVPLDNGTFDPVPPPATGTLRFDGLEGSRRPTGWPTLVQLLDAQGRPLSTAYLFPGEAMPAYDAGKPAVTAVAGPEPAGRSRRGAGLALVGATAASGLASGLLYGLAGANAADFERDHPAWDRADLVGQRARTNDLVAASGALAAVAAGCALTATFVVRW